MRKEFQFRYSVDVIRTKSYVAGFSKLSSVTGRVMINITNLVLSINMSRFINVF